MFPWILSHPLRCQSVSNRDSMGLVCEGVCTDSCHLPMLCGNFKSLRLFKTVVELVHVISYQSKDWRTQLRETDISFLYEPCCTLYTLVLLYITEGVNILNQTSNVNNNNNLHWIIILQLILLSGREPYTYSTYKSALQFQINEPLWGITRLALVCRHAVEFRKCTCNIVTGLHHISKGESG